MAVCACDLKERGLLPDNTFVATVLSNLGLHKYAEKCGLHVECSSVGDRNVLELMQKGGYALGGEQSGHVIFLNHSTTGDGQLTALQFLSILKKSGKKLSGLVSDIPQYPQIIINVRLKIRLRIRSWRTATSSSRYRRFQNPRKRGQVLVRPSGTEPVIRVMVEERYSRRFRRLPAMSRTLSKPFPKKYKQAEPRDISLVVNIINYIFPRMRYNKNVIRRVFSKFSNL